MGTAEARRELEALERLRYALGAIARREDGDRRRALVDLRRELSLQLARVTGACDLLFSAEPARHLEADWRHRLSKVRTVLALHQANCPAVKIDDDRTAYLASATAARAAEKDLMNWVETVLDGLDGRGPLPDARA